MGGGGGEERVTANKGCGAGENLALCLKILLTSSNCKAPRVYEVGVKIEF